MQLSPALVGGAGAGRPGAGRVGALACGRPNPAD